MRDNWLPYCIVALISLPMTSLIFYIIIILLKDIRDHRRMEREAIERENKLRWWKKL